MKAFYRGRKYGDNGKERKTKSRDTVTLQRRPLYDSTNFEHKYNEDETEERDYEDKYNRFKTARSGMHLKTPREAVFSTFALQAPIQAPKKAQKKSEYYEIPDTARALGVEDNELNGKDARSIYNELRRMDVIEDDGDEEEDA